jgi:hypothetical protein
MRRWRVEGANRETGQAEVAFVGAQTEQEVREWASAGGLLVSSVTDAGPTAEKVPTKPAAAAPPTATVVALDRQSLHSIIVSVAFGIILSHILTAFLVFALIMFLIFLGFSYQQP